MGGVKIESFDFRGCPCRNFLGIRRNKQIMLKVLFFAPTGIDCSTCTQQNAKFDLWPSLLWTRRVPGISQSITFGRQFSCYQLVGQNRFCFQPLRYPKRRPNANYLWYPKFRLTRGNWTKISSQNPIAKLRSCQLTASNALAENQAAWIASS